MFTELTVKFVELMVEKLAQNNRIKWERGIKTDHLIMDSGFGAPLDIRLIPI